MRNLIGSIIWGRFITAPGKLGMINNPTEEQYKMAGYKLLIKSPTPEINPYTQNIRPIYTEDDDYIYETIEVTDKPDEQLTKEYEARVKSYVRQRYAEEDELAIMRRKLAGDESVAGQFEAYNLYCEECKERAKHPEVQDQIEE